MGRVFIDANPNRLGDEVPQESPLIRFAAYRGQSRIRRSARQLLIFECGSEHTSTGTWIELQASARGSRVLRVLLEHSAG
jgi:hypothetical protein